MVALGVFLTLITCAVAKDPFMEPLSLGGQR